MIFCTDKIIGNASFEAETIIATSFEEAEKYCKANDLVLVGEWVEDIEWEEDEEEENNYKINLN